jgi:multiple sugar transport system permease protein
MGSTSFNWRDGILLSLALFFCLFPVFWIVSTSFKPPQEWVASPPVWVSERPTLNNYRAVFVAGQDAEGGTTQTGIGTVTDTAWRAILGSFGVSLAATAMSVLAGLFAAIAIGRYRFGGNVTPFFILSGRMFPPIAIAIPFVIMFGGIGLIDTWFGLILVYAAFTVPFSTWMLKSFVDELPKEIEEAAMMDGLSRMQAHMRFTVPLMRGGIIATALFIFILNWSEFLFALVLSYTNVITIPVQLAKYFTATAGTLYGVQAALGTIAVIPLVLAGFFIQKHLVRGLTLGAIKR